MLKKISALLLALAMVMSLASVAWAADGDPATSDPTTTTPHTNKYNGSEKDEALVTGTEIPLTKSIVLFNTDGSEIREPNISFTYEVTPVDPTEANQGKPMEGVTVTDDGTRNEVDGTKTPVTVTVYDGVAAAFANDPKLELAFSEENTVVAAQDGTEVEKTGSLIVDPSKFPHAGIYRFVITETADPETVTNVGLDERTSNYKSTRYLDVYIKNGTAGLEMYGAVIFTTTMSSDGKVTTTTDKTTGFEPADDTGFEDDETVDKYHTFNLTVNKTITGGLADKTHDFPFEITLTGDKTAAIKTDFSMDGATYVGTAPADNIVSISTTAVKLTPALSDGDSVTITGIPVGTTVLVKETNDTFDEYTPSITTQTGFTGLALHPDAALKKGDSTQLSAAAKIEDKTQNSVIGLTNTLAEISPTGVVMRVAPYALILAAGMALLLISRRRKAVVEE